MHVILSSFYTCIIAQEENGNVVSQGAALHSPTIGTMLCTSAVAGRNPGFVPSNPGTPRVSPYVTPHHTDDELDAVSDHSNRSRVFKTKQSRDSHMSKGQYTLSVYTFTVSLSLIWCFEQCSFIFLAPKSRDKSHYTELSVFFFVTVIIYFMLLILNSTFAVTLH